MGVPHELGGQEDRAVIGQPGGEGGAGNVAKKRLGVVVGGQIPIPWNGSKLDLIGGVDGAGFRVFGGRIMLVLDVKAGCGGHGFRRRLREIF